MDFVLPTLWFIYSQSHADFENLNIYDIPDSSEMNPLFSDFSRAKLKLKIRATVLSFFVATEILYASHPFSYKMGK
jgi:hypothetical protein